MVKLKKIGVLMFVLMAVIAMGTVTVLAADPYTEVAFVEYDSWDEEGVNEFHADILKTESGNADYGNIGGTFNGAWIEFDEFDFGDTGSGKVTINCSVNSARCAPDGSIEIWIDGMTADNGTKVGTLSLEATGTDWNTFEDQTGNLDKKITGKHNLFFVLKGTTSTTNPFIANIAYFKFDGTYTASSSAPAATTASAAATTETTQTATATATPTEEIKTTAPTTAKTATPTQTTATAAPSSAANDGENDDNGDFPVVLVVVIVVALAAIGAAAYYFLKVKKSK